MPTDTRPRPIVAIDVVALCFVPSSKKEPLGTLRVLLKYRKDEGMWSLPGNFLKSSEKKKFEKKEGKNPSETDEQRRERRRFEKEVNEYGPEAEAVPQTVRRVLQMEVINKESGMYETVYLSKYYNLYDENGQELREGERSPEDFQPDEFFVQLPVRSAVRRDADRVRPVKDRNGKVMTDKDGKVRLEHPNYRVISLPFLTMLRPESVEPPTTSKNVKYQFVPLEWILEDNERLHPEVGRLRANPEGKEKLPDVPRDLTEFKKGYFTLPFDHAQIIVDSIISARGVLRSQPIGRQLLAEKFKLSDLNRIYDEICGYHIDTSNFRKCMKDRGGRKLLKDTGEDAPDTARGSAKLVEFDNDLYDKYTANLNFNFIL